MYINAKNVALQLTETTRYTIYATPTQNVVSGSIWSDTVGGIANSILSGGLGNDRYALWDASAKVIEKANEGIDTVEVLYWGGYVLPDNVENLVLSHAAAYWGTGNALDNVLMAGTAGATLDGKAGDDVLVGGKGADVFKVAAGNGSDTIVGFQSGWDVIQLSGYGISSFAQLKAASVQKGADVEIGFTNGEKLVVRGTKLTDLTAADFGFSAIGGTVPSTMKVMNGATNAWNTNGVYALNLAWNPGSLKYGTDYQIESIVNTADLTKNATFNWSFPTSTDLNFSIKAYPSLMFGVSPYGDTKNVNDTAHTFPVKLTDLVAMKADFDTTFSGNKGGFNVSYDIWFTNTPNGGPETMTNELMIWTHKGTFDAFGKLLGTFDAGGVKGKIYNSGTYTAIITDQDVPKGSFDLGAVFTELQKMKILAANTYVASIQLGSEVSTGTGSLTVNNFALSVETRDGAGGTILKQASGAGTIVTHKPAPIEAPASAPAPAPAPAPAIAAPVETIVVKESALDKLVAAGAQKIADANGLLAGATQTRTLSATKTETLRYDAGGAVVASDVVELTNGIKSIAQFDANKVMTGTDMVFVNATSTVTKHYDKWWNYTGQDTATKGANGATVVKHYNASGVLTSTDSTRVDGKTTIKEWWNDKAGTAGVTTSTLDAAGNGKVEQLDGRWKLLSYDEYSHVNGISTVKHYDGNKVLLGSETITVQAGGVRVEQKLDQAGSVTKTTFAGTAANDTVVLSGAVTEVHAGKGSDVLWAGSGADAFHFDTAMGTDIDTIHGFSVAQDDIFLATSVFGNLPTSGGAIASSAFAIDVAKDANTRIIYDSKDGSLYYDADGTGSKAAVLFAHLDAGLALTASNFHLI